MQTFKKIFLTLFLAIVLVFFVVKIYYPNFGFLTLSKSIVSQRIDLPAIEMFLPAHEGTALKVEKSDRKFVFSGPYLSLFNGSYTLNYELVNLSCTNRSLGYLDVVKKKGSILMAKKEIVASQNESQLEAVAFSGTIGDDYEFRLYSYGNCDFEVKEIFLKKNRTDFKGFLNQVWGKIGK